MAIIPWRRSDERSLAQRGGDPFSYLRHQINRVFDDFWDEPWLARGETLGGFAPQVDVTETDKEVKVCAEIPGVEAKDIDVSVEDGTLTIRGEKKYEREENAKAKAEFKNGVLRLTLPKRPGAQSRRKRIPVK